MHYVRNIIYIDNVINLIFITEINKRTTVKVNGMGDDDDKRVDMLRGQESDEYPSSL